MFKLERFYISNVEVLFCPFYQDGDSINYS